jgi:hypothetical protein
MSLALLRIRCHFSGFILSAILLIKGYGTHSFCRRSSFFIYLSTRTCEGILFLQNSTLIMPVYSDSFTIGIFNGFSRLEALLYMQGKFVKHDSSFMNPSLVYISFLHNNSLFHILAYGSQDSPVPSL